MTEDQILYEDNHYICINKPAGMLVQGDSTGDSCLLDEVQQFIKKRDNKPGNVFVGLIHRLDRPTSGAVLLAKTSKGLSRMNERFRNRDQVQKTYWAAVDGIPDMPTGEKQHIEHWLRKNAKQNKSYAVTESTKGAKKAILDYTLLCSGDRYSLVEVDLFTGRHHQIRCQLASIGLTIKGDVKYGAKRPNNDGSIHLHARSLEFIQPISGKKVSVTARPPSDPLWDFFNSQAG